MHGWLLSASLGARCSRGCRAVCGCHAHEVPRALHAVVACPLRRVEIPPSAMSSCLVAG